MVKGLIERDGDLSGYLKSHVAEKAPASVKLLEEVLAEAERIDLEFPIRFKLAQRY